MNTSPLRVAFVCYKDARDVRSWSGIPTFAKRSVDAHIGSVTDLSPFPYKLWPERITAALLQRLTHKNYHPEQDARVAQRMGAFFTDALKQNPCDIVFAPGASGIVACLETNIPIIYFSDATWHLVHNFYSAYTNTTARNARDADELERRAIQRSDIAVFSSRWAAQSAIEDYGADPAKVFDIGIGANLIHPPPRPAIPRKAPGSGGRIRLLMMGVSWEIKGGAIAFETLLKLLELGFNAELTVVGCTAPKGVSHPRLRVIPFLNKQIPEQNQMLDELWRQADVFILPSRFECAAIVFCEAAAYGLPIFATDTGGVSSLVIQGVNGYTLPLQAGGAEYAAGIAELVSDPVHYAAMCLNSRDLFEQRLSWDAWGKALAGIVAARLPLLADRLRV